MARTAGLLAELFGTPMAAGTGAAWTSRAAGLAPLTAAVRAGLRGAKLGPAEETGRRLAGRRHWLPVVCSARCTALFCHRTRSTQALAAAGVLPDVTGIVVHDAFAAYARYRCATHALGNPHLLRELGAVVLDHGAHPASTGGMPAGRCWAGQVIDTLRALTAITDTGALPSAEVLAAHRRLIVSAALVSASAAASPPGAVSRRHRALARRSTRRLDDYLRLAVDPRAPFDNNAAEPDSRMV